MEAAGGVFPFRDVRWDPDPMLEAHAAVRLPTPVPLVLDNGSFQLRLGWACPHPAVPGEPLLQFRSLVARSRGVRGGAGPETQVGNDLGSPEPLRWLLRSPFDRNVPVQMELQEQLFDHGFQRLGVSSQIPDLDPVGSEQSMEDVESMNDFDPLFAEEQPEVEKPVTTVQPVFNLAEYHQLFLGTERIRVPEIVFQPSLIGEEQAGIAETMQFVLDRYSKDQQEKLVQNVFLTGGNVMYPGMKARIQKELLEMRPFQSSFQVHLASNPVLDAWYGARDWALEYMNREEGWITRKDYEEKGGEYLKEHCASNVYVPIRLPKQTPRTVETSSSNKMPGTEQT